jgi:UMF1 family MFS transporter
LNTDALAGAPGAARQRWSWAAYDWANSTFATTVIAGFFPLFFQRFWSAGVSGTDITLHLGVGNAAASGFIFVVAPVLGAIADGGTRKRFLIGFTLLGCASTAAFYEVGEGAWMPALALFVLGSIGYSGAVIFYDALLKDVCPPSAYDRVSSLGYGLGYLGGGLLFALNVAMVLHPHWFGLSGESDAVRLSFVLVAAWWLVFTAPLVFWVRERSRPAGAGGIMRGLRQLRATLGRIRQLRQVLLFLVAYWLYIDGVSTIIRMAVNYGLALGFDPDSLILALLITQFVGFPAAIGFGRLGERLGTRRAIFLAIAVYMAVTVGGFFMQNTTQFYVMAAVIGLVQGGIQALSRAFYARLVPAAESGEFFGFYNMLGKFAAVLGPLLVGVTAALTGSQRLAILSILVLFILGAVFLWLVDEEKAAAGAR